ncbi:hypothetical protein BC332_08161 [Capsicum chinense]|nr:hypothetical protein BC332_08161 [Capsicum chinense]
MNDVMYETTTDPTKSYSYFTLQLPIICSNQIDKIIPWQIELNRELIPLPKSSDLVDSTNSREDKMQILNEILKCTFLHVFMLMTEKADLLLMFIQFVVPRLDFGATVLTVMMVVIDNGGGGCDVTSLDVSSLRHIVKALLKFWNSIRVVFKFKDFELTPTIEEIGGFIDLKYQGRDMRQFKVNFGPLFEIPREMELLRKWGNLMKIDVLNEQDYCNPEYYVWLSADIGEVGFSRQGQAIGYEDLEETKWAHSILINHFVIPPEMWEQVISGSLAHFGA